MVQRYDDSSEDDNDPDGEVVISDKTRRHLDRDHRRLERHEHRKSMEARLDTLTNAVEVMQQLMMKNANQGRNQTCHKVLGASESETTIYHNALRPLPGESMAGSVNKAIIPLHLSDKPDKRVSSSSEEDGPIDTSDELIDGAVIAQLNVLSAWPGQDGSTVK